MYYKDLTPNLDILFFQEHKMQGEKAKNLRAKVWKEAMGWYLEINLRYKLTFDRLGKRGGGEGGGGGTHWQLRGWELQ
jgi:hypothetical protein